MHGEREDRLGKLLRHRAGFLFKVGKSGLLAHGAGVVDHRRDTGSLEAGLQFIAVVGLDGILCPRGGVAFGHHGGLHPVGEQLGVALGNAVDSLELFVNDGEQAASFVLYTPLEAASVSFSSDGSVLVDVEKYDLLME